MPLNGQLQKLLTEHKDAAVIKNVVMGNATLI